MTFICTSRFVPCATALAIVGKVSFDSSTRLARVVDDPPTPVGIHRGRERDDLHLRLAPTSDSRRARRSGTRRRSVSFF